MPHLELVEKQPLSTFRKLAIGTWSTTYDPQVYGAMSIRMDAALAYQREFREKTGRRLTITHMMAKAAAAVFEGMPDANAILRFNRIYLRNDIAIFFQVAMKDEHTGELDLSGATVHHAETKTLLEVVDDFQATVERVRSRRDKQLEGTRSTMSKVPLMLMNSVLKTVAFLSYTLNLDLGFLGIPRDPFGSCMITNIGSLGLEEAYVPLVPYSRVPLILATGAVRKEFVVGEDDQPEVAQMMKIFATFDHRILDGAHASHMSKTMRKWFEDPYTHFGPIPEPDPG